MGDPRGRSAREGGRGGNSVRSRIFTDRVLGQLNIYDSIPVMKKYSLIWQFIYVIVPRDYVPNSLRSERDCIASGYQIRQSRVFEN